MPNYIGIDETEESMRLRRNCKPDDMVLCEKTQKMYVYDGQNWSPLEIKEGLNIPLYEINKSTVSAFPEYDQEKINQLQDNINDWETSSDYYMLLCNDIKYYTVLRRTQHKKAVFPDLGQAVTNLLLERDYKIQAEEICDDHFEIWIKDKEEEVYMFALFPYDWGVINYG